MRLGLTLAPGEHFGGSEWSYPSIALSPDGAHMAYVATRGGVTQLYLRDTAESDDRPLPGTGGAHTPFFSPDGKWLGAIAGGKLVKFPVTGGAPVTVSPLPFKVYGACWAADGWIYLGGEAPIGLLKVMAAGSIPFGVAALDNKKKRETGHRFPDALPGGKWLLFAAQNANQRNFDQADIQAFSMKTGEYRTLVKGGANPHYIPTGHLVFVRAGVLMAAPFDPDKVELKGAPVPVVEGVIENPRTGAGQYSVSADGSLAYLPGGVTYGDRQLVFVDRGGAARVLTAKARPYEDLMLSPDGRLIATTIAGPETDAWIHDIARDADTRFTSGSERKWPAWSADGKHFVYAGFDKDGYSIFWKPLDGTGEQEELVDSDEKPAAPGFASRDGRTLLYEVWSDSGPHDIMLVSLEKHFPRPLIATPPDEDWAQISPDGRSIAYNTDGSGRAEVYVATFPDIGSKVKVSTEGGRHPQWSPNGKELYYLMSPTADAPRPREHRVRLMAVPVETSPAFKAGAPHVLFEGPFFESIHDYAVTPDGKGFLFIRESPESGPGEMKVVLNWDDEMSRRLPVK
jgi:serine/threonine-protein kinase